MNESICGLVLLMLAVTNLLLTMTYKLLKKNGKQNENG